ncbi:hypothetical protein ACC862_23990 [Rhizobium ruizarguesonis]
MGQQFSEAPQNETRTLRVSVWLGFASASAEVSVAGEAGAVTIHNAWVENVGAPLTLKASDLDRLGLMRAAGPVTLRAAIEGRAREEAFA